MKLIKEILIFIFFAGIVVSCTENVEYEVGNQDPVIVVDGFFTSEKKAHEIKLTWSSEVYNTDAPKPVEGATVTISSGSEIIALTENFAGIYQTNDSTFGEIGKSYALNISYNGENYSSNELLLKDIPDMDCAFIVNGDTSNSFTRSSYLILMAADEPEGVGDYYLWNFYINDTLFTDTIGEKIYNSDELIDGAEFTGIPIFFYDTNEVDVHKDLRLEMLSINKEYYEFLIAMQLENFRGSPFDGPAANVPTNMNNGALGFFVVSDITSSGICKMVKPFDQISSCSMSCFETMCKIGLIPCADCQSVGIDC